MTAFNTWYKHCWGPSGIPLAQSQQTVNHIEPGQQSDHDEHSLDSSRTRMLQHAL